MGQTPTLFGQTRVPASLNPTSTPPWFEWLEALQSLCAPRGMSKIFFSDGGGGGRRCGGL